MGAFTIIVCGEAFVKVAIAVSGSSVLEVDVVALFFQFVLTFAIWTSYFEDVPKPGFVPVGSDAWLGFHLVLQLAIAGTAIGVAKLVKVGPLDHLPSVDILEITATLATRVRGARPHRGVHPAAPGSQPVRAPSRDARSSS